jgi:uncharacterized protein involved in exopolysaccharide biosynthesis
MDSVTEGGATWREPRSDLDILATYARRNWWIVAASVVACLLLGVGYLAIAKPSYDASAVVIVQPQNSDPNAQQLPATPELVRSQVEVLQSRRVLDAVVSGLKLYRDPEFGGSTAFAPTPYHIAAAEQALSDRLKVDNDGRSFAISITVRSRDPDKSARIANAIANTDIDQERARKVALIQSTQNGLASRLSDLRTQTLAAENAAESFRQASGLVPLSSIPEDSESYSAATPASREIIELAKENASLAGDASQTRARLMAQQREIASGRGDSTTEVLASPVVSNLRAQEAEVAKREAELLAKYRPDHPLVRPIEDQLSRIRGAIGSEIGRIHSSVASQARASAQAFGSANGYMRSLSSRRSGELASSVRLTQLQDDAKLKRQVYTEFAGQMQRAAERAGLQLPDVNLASAASAPIRPAAPKKSFVLLASVIAGLMLGLVLGFARSLAVGRALVVENRSDRS